MLTISLHRMIISACALIKMHLQKTSGYQNTNVATSVQETKKNTGKYSFNIAMNLYLIILI